MSVNGANQDLKLLLCLCTQCLIKICYSGTIVWSGIYFVCLFVSQFTVHCTILGLSILFTGARFLNEVTLLNIRVKVFTNNAK